MMTGGQPVCAAQRRRGRRLRAAWRHEQRPIPMALAAATHDCSRTPLHEDKPKSTRATEEEQDQHNAPRRQKTPPLTAAVLRRRAQRVAGRPARRRVRPARGAASAEAERVSFCCRCTAAGSTGGGSADIVASWGLAREEELC